MKPLAEILTACDTATAKNDVGALRSAVDELKHIDDDLARAHALYYAGIERRISGELVAAEGLLSRALAAYEQMELTPQIAGTLNELAVHGIRSGDFNAALGHAQRALELFQQLDSVEGIALTTSSIGIILLYLGDYHSALGHFQESQRIHFQLDRPLHAAKDEFNIATVHAGLGDLQNALKSYENVAATYRALGYDVGDAHARISIGTTHYELGDLPLALEILSSTIDFLERNELLDDLAVVYSVMGQTYMAAELYEQAVKWLHAACEITERSGLWKSLAHQKLLLGGVYCAKGDTESAIGCLHEAIAFARETGIQWLEFDSRRQLCEVYLDQERWEEARQIIEDLSGTTIASPDSNVWYLLNCARYDLHCQRYDAAEDALNTARELCSEHGYHSHEVEVLKQFRELAAARGDMAAYIEYNTVYLERREAIRGTTAQIRIATLAKEQEIELERHERELAQLKSERLETSMQRQQQLLSVYAANLVRQTELVDELRESILTMIKSSISPDGAVEAIRDRLADRPTAESNWQRFFRQFTEVHPDVEPNLRTRIPTISATELKVCCLLLMGMNTRDIATLLFVSERTIDIHRGHIRKKLELERQHDLRTALAAVAMP